MPLATRDPYKQVSEGKEMPGCQFLLWELPVQLFLALEEEK